MKKENSASVLIPYLRHLNVRVTATSIQEELEKHPNHPSLFAISDVLNYWGVSNGAFNVEFDSFSEIPLPCIAHLSANSGEFALVSKLEGDTIYVSNNRWNNYKMSLEDFRKVFSGNILIAEADQTAGETDYKLKKRTEVISRLRYPVLITGVLLLLMLSIFQHSTFRNNVDVPTVLASLFKTAGLITSILLLIYSIDSRNSITDRLCTGEKKNNCNAILSSNAAKITEYLSWSEVGFFYFAGTLLALLFNTHSEARMQSLAYINLLCLPYTFYSAYYQVWVVKQWCIFCTTVQAILWMEFYAFFPYLLTPIQMPDLSDVTSLVVCFLSPVLLWGFVKPFLIQSMKIKPLQIQLKQFKYNSTIFYKSLEEQKKNELLDESDTVVLGNLEAENTITIVTNPYCQPCSKAHQILEQWLTERDSFKIQLVFSAENNSDDPKTKIARHLHSLNTSNKSLVREAVHHWYEGKSDVESWIKAYPISKEHDSFESIERQKNWCSDVGVTGTPTIFLNGHQIPQPWLYQDIKYFI